jgi:UDP-N-acetylglucosamine transferase subunit ALG13
MIFVTVGMNEFPFDRLLYAVDSLANDEPLIVQHGVSAVRPGGAECVESLSFDRLVESMNLARRVVAHAGVGSVMVALATGRRPILMPRRQKFGEHIDDHQVGFAYRLREAGLADVIECAADLSAAVGDEEEPRTFVYAESPLVTQLQDYSRSLLGLGDLTRRRGTTYERLLRRA